MIVSVRMTAIPASANAAATRQALRMRSAYWTPASPIRRDQSLHLVALDVRGEREPLREKAGCRCLASARVAADDPDLGALGGLTGRFGSHRPSLVKPSEIWGDTRPHYGL